MLSIAAALEVVARLLFIITAHSLNFLSPLVSRVFGGPFFQYIELSAASLFLQGALFPSVFFITIEYAVQKSAKSPEEMNYKEKRNFPPFFAKTSTVNLKNAE